MTLTLEIGRYYRTRDGRKVGPLKPGEQHPIGPWLFKTTDPLSYYRANGRSYPDGGENQNKPDDLIAEWTEDTPEPDGPVRKVVTETVEIVPGTYNYIEVNMAQPSPGHVNVRLKGDMNAEELRAAATTLAQLADALDLK